ncbi:MAG TPA: patatin family protein [Pasteurellaceae bacterium]|nr:patatin family protein [Pasteurellaceae bacterium]
MKVGLVLEGGAMRGMFTAGVLDVFLDEHIEINGIVSVSAGALFGANFPSKQRGRAIRYNRKYLNDNRYMGLHSLLTTGNIVNKDFAFYKLPFTLDPFDQSAFATSNIDFYVTLTNVESGKPEYFKIKDIFKEMELLRATSAMPFVSKIVEYNDKKYLDGGISDSIPLHKCRQLGYDKLIVVLTRSLEYRKPKAPTWLFKLFYRKYPELVKTLANRHLNYNQSVEEIINLNDSKKIFVIRPSKTLDIKRLEQNSAKIQAMYDLGIADARQAMEGLKQYLAE